MADPRQGPVRLSFLGAADTVTGSKYLLETAGRKLLVDSGLFQGPPALRERNWQPLPLPAAEIDAVFLTHAHLDHSGYLPVLWKQGFTGPVYCTSGTTALAGILLPDSGFLQQEDAEYAR
ncbi:MAG: MBL fold metallo-hydrolase, partial [Pseudomonadales bacterium]